MHTYIEQLTIISYKYYTFLPYVILLVLLMLIVWAVHEKGL